MSKAVYLTPEGLEKLKSELKELVEVRRPDLAIRLREAIAMGDLSENADYHACKEESGFLEGRIKEIENMVRNAEIITEKRNAGVVTMGSTVTIQFDEDDPETYRVVGPNEADPRKGNISNESPIGKALMGAKAGQSITAQTPSGAMTVKVLSIE
ncbi:MAG TPA: transcription elongation factor GreA [Anaerolineales bacterium]|nr:transcription elongation factor GreA [Anaerolineales bacterium]